MSLNQFLRVNNLLNSGAFIFTSGKGGVGKTPYAITFALALKELGKRVIALDFNFHNPDLFEIMLKLGYEEVEFIDRYKGERLTPSLTVLKVKGDEGKNLYTSARVDKYRYAPYPPDQIFKSLLALIEHFGSDDLFIVVDTNLNIMSFNLVDPSKVVVYDAVINSLDGVWFNYLLTPSFFARSFERRTVNDLEQMEKTVNTFNKFKINLLGTNGEKINYILTPTVIDQKALKKGFFNTLRSVIVGRKGQTELTISMHASIMELVREYLNDVMEPYRRSSRYIMLKDLKEINEGLLELVENSHINRLEVLNKMNAEEVQSLFLSALLDMLYDKATNTLPRNVIFVPFIVESMINFIDVVLLAENLTLDFLKKRLYGIYPIIREWLKEVLLKG